MLVFRLVWIFVYLSGSYNVLGITFGIQLSSFYHITQRAKVAAFSSISFLQLPTSVKYHTG
jgi:hypothetical protein